MERILELAMKHAAAAEVFRIERSQIPVVFRRGRLATVEQEESVGFTLRLVKDGRIGFSATTKADEPEELVQQALAASQVGPEGVLNFSSLHKDFGEGDFFDRSIEKMSTKKLIAIGEEMFEIIKRELPELETSGDISRTVEGISVLNSNGGKTSYRRTALQAFIYAILVLDNERAELEHTYSSTRLDDGPQKMAKAAVWRFNHCKKIAPLATKHMPVIFTSLAFRGLYVPLFFSLNGQNVLRKTSRLTGMLGQKIADTSFTLIDDPCVPQLTASCPIDDEGTPAGRKELIKNGVLQGFFYDLLTADKAGVEPTGNGFKKGSIYEPFRLDVPPSAWPSSFIIPAGDAPRQQMIQEIEEGLIVDDTIGAGQGNNLNGEFAMNVALGYKIEKGQIVGRVKDVMVAGNIFDLFNKIKRIGHQQYHEDTLFGRYYVPWICFDDVSVAST